MKTLTLGHSGIEVSALCLGILPFGTKVDEPTSFAILDAYFAAGGRFIDRPTTTRCGTRAASAPRARRCSASGCGHGQPQPARHRHQGWVLPGGIGPPLQHPLSRPMRR